jgi:hypothetical protein
MANVSVVAASVKVVTDIQPQWAGAGEALTQGQLVYQSATDGLWYKADSIGTNTRFSVARLVLSPASANGRVSLAVPGSEIDLGVTLTVGEPLFLSATSAGGNLCPIGDLVSTNYVIFCGIARTAAIFVFNPIVVAVKKP